MNISFEESKESRKSNKKLYHHFFEEFFIVGINPQDILEHGKESWKQQEIKRFNPQTLYTHISPLHNHGHSPNNNAIQTLEKQEEENERINVVKDFCFPDGVEVRKLKKSNSLSHA